MTTFFNKSVAKARKSKARKDRIRKKMHRLSDLASRMWQLSHEIEEELCGLGVSLDSLRDSSGVSLEELELGNDITDELLEKVWPDD